MRRGFCHGSLSCPFVQDGGWETLRRGQSRDFWNTTGGWAIIVQVSVKTVQLLTDERCESLRIVACVCSIEASRLPGKRALIRRGSNSIHQHQVFFASFVWYFKTMAFSIVQDGVEVGSDKRAEIIQECGELVLGLKALCTDVRNDLASF